jgi:type IV secretion system protein VirD4
MMQKCDGCEGMIRRTGNQIARINDKELDSVLSTLFEHVSFLNSPLMRAFTACLPERSFDPNVLLSGKTTVYFGLPADQIRPLNRLVRLQLTAVIRAFMRVGPDRSRSCMLFLDELAQLGPMPILEDAITLLRGYGLKTWSCLQSRGQVSDIFPGEKAQTFLSNMDVTQFYVPNDYATAQEISESLGKSTIAVSSQNGNEGWSTSTPDTPANDSSGKSGGGGGASSRAGGVKTWPQSGHGVGCSAVLSGTATVCWQWGQRRRMSNP